MNNSARESQPVAARFAFLLDRPVLDKPIDRVFDIRFVTRKHFQIAQSQKSCRSPKRSRVFLSNPQAIARSAFRPPFEWWRAAHPWRDRLPPRRFHAPVSSCADATGIEQRAHEFLREKRIAFAVPRTDAHEARRRVRTADERFQKGAVLGRRERPKRDRRVAPVAAGSYRASGRADAALSTSDER